VTFLEGNSKSERGEEEVLRVRAPAMDGFRSYQTGRVALGCVTHLKRISIREVGRDVAGIGDGNVWAFFSEMDVIAVVVEAMRE
jgi:hypothetical protein